MAGKRRARELDVVSAATPTRQLTVLAQDPSVTNLDGSALTARVRLPQEPTTPGPHGHRVRVVDFDASTGHYYAPYELPARRDEFEHVTDVERLVADPRFHAQNVYAIAMSTLWQFEAALGRHVPWAFLGSRGHQLNIAPHAFADANAFYSRHDEGLFFGYVPKRRGAVFTCLSFDIVTHETAHALLDGMRNFYVRPSSSDQAAFHEGFADLVAILSVLHNTSVVERLLTLRLRSAEHGLISAAEAADERLRESVIFGVAEELGPELGVARGRALRHSVHLEPGAAHLDLPRFQEPHHRGEILVAAMMRAFLEVWGRRLDPLGRKRKVDMNLRLVAEEASAAAQQLLRMAIRALDYCPPVDLSFSDYLSALATADHELVPDDGRYKYRRAILEWFGRFGIRPAANADVAGPARGIWDPPEPMRYDGTHFETLKRDPDAVFKFIWRNQKALGIDTTALTRVYFVRPCIRMGLDRFVVQETVAEYMQTIDFGTRELSKLGVRRSANLPRGQKIRLYGGGTLIFDEFGRLKFHIGTGVRSRRQAARIRSLADGGYFLAPSQQDRRPFASLHRSRSYVTVDRRRESW